MRPRPLAFLSCWVLSAGLAACGGSGPGDATGSTCPSDSTLTSANFGQAFFQTNCAACHGSGGPQSPKLDSAATIRANKDNVDRSAAAGPSAVNTYMPESGSVAEADRRKLGEWLACGAPD